MSRKLARKAHRKIRNVNLADGMRLGTAVMLSKKVIKHASNNVQIVSWVPYSIEQFTTLELVQQVWNAFQLP